MQGDDLAVAAAAVPVTEEKVEESEEKHQQQPPQHEEAVKVEGESGTPESSQAEVGEMHSDEVKAAEDEMDDKSLTLEGPTEVSPQVEEAPKVAESTIEDAPAAAEPVMEATSTEEASLESLHVASTQPEETLSLPNSSEDVPSKHQQDDAPKLTSEDAPAESVTKDVSEVSELPAQEAEDSTAEFVDAPNTMMETTNEGDEEPVVKESVDEDQKEVEAVDEKSVVEVENSEAPKSTANELSEEEKSSIISSSATPEETATVDSPQSDVIKNQPAVANKISTREYVQTPPMSASTEEKSLTVSEPAEKDETSDATPTSTITQENSVEEKSVEENGSAVPTAVVAKENGDDGKVSSQADEPSVQLKELQSNGDDAATKDSVAVEESGKEDDKKSESLEQLLVKEGAPSATAKSNGTEKGAVDEEKTLEEMRAKIAEQDPLSKDTDEATLRRFLRARSWKLSKAVKMFVDHQKWRRSFVPLGHIPQEQVKNELEAEKVFLQGNDRNGRPVVVILAAKHDANKRKFDEFKRYLVFNFDTTVASLKPGEETFTVILDLKGLALKNLDVRGWISTFDFLQAYYPERLGRLFIVHVPKIFWGAWKLVYPFIDKVTRDKILFVEDKLLEQKLQEEIEKEQIADIYGGTLPLVPIQNVVIPNWPPRQEDAIPQSTS